MHVAGDGGGGGGGSHRHLSIFYLVSDRPRGDDHYQRGGNLYHSAGVFHIVQSYFEKKKSPLSQMVVIVCPSFWCIDVPSMVAISLTGLLVHILQ